MIPPTATALFIAYFEVGISGFGGANAWARRMMVEKRGWLTDAEYAERLGLGQVLPGPNALNAAIIIGHGFAGVRGAVAAGLGLFAGPMALLAGLAALYDAYGALPQVRAVLAGVAAAAAGMMLGTALKMVRRVRPPPAMVAVGLAAMGLALWRVPLPWVVFGLAPLGILVAWRELR